MRALLCAAQLGRRHHFMAFVICRVFLTLRMRRRKSSTLAIFVSAA